MAHCTQCGQQAAIRQNFCSRCGSSLPKDDLPRQGDILAEDGVGRQIKFALAAGGVIVAIALLYVTMSTISDTTVSSEAGASKAIEQQKRRNALDPPSSTPLNPVPSQQALALGMERTEVHSLLGSPTQWQSTAGYLNTQIEYLAAMKVYAHDTISDVYTRRTESNLYALKIRYVYDDSASRLNPARRVYIIEFEADKPLEAERMLKDVPEALAMCRDGCRFSYSHFSPPFFFALTKFFSQKVRETVEQYYSPYVNKSTGEVDETVGMVVLELDQRSPREKDWLKQRITSVMLHLTWASKGDRKKPLWCSSGPCNGTPPS